MGRRVKTEGEALEEAKGWATLDEIAGMKDQAQISTYRPQAEIPELTNQSNSADIFSFAKFRTSVQGMLVLEGLEVPEGTWGQLHLQEGDYAHHARSQLDWVQYSNGMSVFNGKRLTPVSGTFRLDRLATAKSLYWFLRAAYQSRNDPAYAEQIRTLKRLFSAMPIVTADRLEIQERPSGPEELELTVYGWQLSHPLDLEATQEKPEPIEYNINAWPVTHIISALFGDPQPERISEVYTWLTNDHRWARFNLNNLEKQNKSAICLNPHNLVSLIPLDAPRKALGLIADDFTPRGVKP